jgi:hypothetical protein
MQSYWSPTVLAGHLIAEYLHFLKDELPLLLQDAPLQARLDMATTQQRSSLFQSAPYQVNKPVLESCWIDCAGHMCGHVYQTCHHCLTLKKPEGETDDTWWTLNSMSQMVLLTWINYECVKEATHAVLKQACLYTASVGYHCKQQATLIHTICHDLH